MRSIIILTAFALIFTLYSCSKRTEENLKEKTEKVAEDVKEKAKDIFEGDSTKKSDTGTKAGDKDVKGTRYVCNISGAKDSKISGKLDVWMDADGDEIRIEGQITGLPPGNHGFHIHEKGVCDAPDFKTAGDHFNPTGKEHGDMSEKSHMGDLGNLKADKDGVAKVKIKLDADNWKLEGKNSIVGKAMVIHEKEDDLKTQPSGDSGNRIACGVIQTAK